MLLLCSTAAMTKIKVVFKAVDDGKQVEQELIIKKKGDEAQLHIEDSVCHVKATPYKRGVYLDLFIQDSEGDDGHLTFYTFWGKEAQMKTTDDGKNFSVSLSAYKVR